MNIQSAQNPVVKHLVKLREDKDYRDQIGRVLVIGYKMVHEVSSKISPHAVYVTDPSFLPDNARDVYSVSGAVMKKISGVMNPEGIVAEVPMAKFPQQEKFDRILVLDGIQDPGNMGTILRTAWALGWDAAYLLGSCCDPYNQKALSASRGAAFFFPWLHISWEVMEKLFHTYQVMLYAGDIQGDDVSTMESLPKNLALILGSEGKGLSQRVQEKSKRIKIPMHQDVDSLNVAVAAGIFLYKLKSHG